MIIETWIQQDLSQIVEVTQLKGHLFHKDADANLLGVYVTYKGLPATLSGTCNGVAILPNGSICDNIRGHIEGNKAWITLPGACYNLPGTISVTIKVGNTTVATFSGNVYRTAT